ncbi:hypothetical protein I316_03936 [Kwoniella heveanensis BCC8398]|uniref:Cytochrome P450 n=1 Tax=Kwoniella heveanensis BCC8398 TaxID=1296120 RepID=A0A1B9GTN2_9TREE|nr:hypothetical protein I316_03936 [Kwoniella heveanensis BCC8398]
MDWLQRLSVIPTTVDEAIPHVLMICAGALILYVIDCLRTYIGVLQQVRGLPTRHGLFPAWEVGLRPRLPHIPFLFPVRTFYSKPEFDIYQKAGSDLLAFTVATVPRPVYFIGSPTSAQHVATNPQFGKASFEKRYENIRQFGSNIVSAYDGGEHRHHKVAIRSCFGEQIFEKVWDNMDKQLAIMIDAEKVEESGGVLHDIGHVLIKLTFAIIGEVGFSVEIPWNIHKTDSAGESDGSDGSEPLTSIYYAVLDSEVVPSLRRYGKARHDYLAHTYRMYRQRRSELVAESDPSTKPPTDLLGALAHAQIFAERSEDKREFGVGLTEEEVISDMFVFLIAGHETTGHTLAFILANLALYPDWQGKLLEEINEVCGDEEPAYRHMNQLQLCLAVGLESLRLFDSARLIFKYAMEDTILPYSTWTKDGTVTQRVHHVKKGALIGLDLPACQKNLFHWKDADKFDPTRHLPANKSSPYLGFSLGARQCIGRRFAEVEIVSFVAKIVKRYRIFPKMEQPHESLDELKRRMLDTAYEDLTLTPGKFDLRLERRE